MPAGSSIGYSPVRGPKPSRNHSTRRSGLATPAAPQATPPPAQPAAPAAAPTVQPAQPGQRPQLEAPKEAPAPAVNPNGQVVEGFEFRGAKRVPQDTLKALIISKPGDIYNEETLRRDFMILWNTGRFDDIRLETEPGRTGLIVRFVVTERRVIRSIEYPGAKSERLICGLLPITMVTAMVSPSALASARKIDPKMPRRAKGTTTREVVCQRVAPRQAGSWPLRARKNGRGRSLRHLAERESPQASFNPRVVSKRQQRIFPRMAGQSHG